MSPEAKAELYQRLKTRGGYDHDRKSPWGDGWTR